MADGTLDDLYLEFLYGIVASTRNRNPSKTHWSLLRQLYSERFSWTVRNDDNRECDGKDLRNEFIIEWNVDDIEPLWLELECSMLEMLIAFSRRVSYQSYGEPADWFWHFINTLELRELTDSVYRDDPHKKVVSAICQRINNRTYNRNGVGGLFPLSGRCTDQRRVELWYQMSTYLLENEEINVLT